MSATRDLPPDLWLELQLIRIRLESLARSRYARGLCRAERDEYERLSDREFAILAAADRTPG